MLITQLVIFNCDLRTNHQTNPTTVNYQTYTKDIHEGLYESSLILLPTVRLYCGCTTKYCENNIYSTDVLHRSKESGASQNTVQQLSSYVISIQLCSCVCFMWLVTEQVKRSFNVIKLYLLYSKENLSF